MIDEIRLKLNNLADINSEIEKMRIYASDQRSAIMATIQPELEAIMASVKPELDALDGEYNQRIAAGLELAEKFESEIRADVIVNGASVKADHLHAVYSKGRVTWDGKKLDGMTNLIPQLADARKEGEPSVTIRKT